jgi:hypothetical protein
MADSFGLKDCNPYKLSFFRYLSVCALSPNSGLRFCIIALVLELDIINPNIKHDGCYDKRVITKYLNISRLIEEQKVIM